MEETRGTAQVVRESEWATRRAGWIAEFWYAADRFFNKCAAFCWKQAQKHDPIWEEDLGDA